MADAPWAPVVITMRYGRDEGGPPGVSWCSLCGRNTEYGVIFHAEGKEPANTVFFCVDCCAVLGKFVAELATHDRIEVPSVSFELAEDPQKESN
jgi:hypothetical protein